MFKECIGCTQKRLDDEPQDDRSHVLCPICRMSRYYKAYKQYITSRMRSKSNLKSTSIERKLRKFITNKFHIITKLYALKQLTSSHKLKEYLQVKNFLLNDRQIKFIFSSKKPSHQDCVFVKLKDWKTPMRLKKNYYSLK